MTPPTQDLPAKPLLRIRDLTVRYASNQRPAVQDISLDISPGECLGLLGASGSGKSTLARTLIGLLPSQAHIDAGSIWFGEREITSLAESEWQTIRGSEISLIFQEPELALNPVLTVGTQIAEVLRAHRRLARAALRANVANLLNQVGLSAPEISSSYPHELSGGQRQRIVIAQAIACRPKLLLADEPTSSLDTLAQSGILELIAHIRQLYGLAVLFITHNPLLLCSLAERVAIFDSNGTIAEIGRLPQIFRSPGHQQTRELLHAVTLLPGESR